jgi:hypothetical protein
VNVVLLAFRPAPVVLSAALPLNVGGTVAELKLLPFAGVVTEAVIGFVLSSVNVIAVPLKVFPTLSVAVACTAYTPSLCDAHVGKVALLVHVTDVLPVVAVFVAARFATAGCHPKPVQ